MNEDQELEFFDILAAALWLSQHGQATTPTGELCRFASEPKPITQRDVVGAQAGTAQRPAELNQTVLGLFGRHGAFGPELCERFAGLPGDEGKGTRDFFARISDWVIACQLKELFSGHIGNGFLGPGTPSTATDIRELAENLLGLEWPDSLPREWQVSRAEHLLQIPSLEAGTNLLKKTFGVPVAALEYQTVWQMLPEQEAATRKCQAIKDPLGGLTFKLGPLSGEQFATFVPGGPALQPLLQLARLFAGSLALDIRLELQAGEVLPASQAMRLDWTACALEQQRSRRNLVAHISRATCELVERGEWQPSSTWTATA